MATVFVGDSLDFSFCTGDTCCCWIGSGGGDGGCGAVSFFGDNLIISSLGLLAVGDLGAVASGLSILFVGVLGSSRGGGDGCFGGEDDVGV